MVNIVRDITHHYQKIETYRDADKPMIIFELSQLH